MSAAEVHSAEERAEIARRYRLDPAPEAIVSVDVFQGLPRILAEAGIRQRGYHTCTRGGLRTLVLPLDAEGLR